MICNVSINEIRVGNIGKNNNLEWKLNVKNDMCVRFSFKIYCPTNYRGQINVLIKNNLDVFNYALNQRNTTLNEVFSTTKGSLLVTTANTFVVPIKYNLQFTKVEKNQQENQQYHQQTAQNKKYALLVGISDYLYINDLSFCDEDVVSWADYLCGLGYEITILGDKTSCYGKYKVEGLATEENVRNNIKKIGNKISAGDKFLFISSGHGSGDGTGNSFLCCLEENGTPNGEYTDKEFASDVKHIVNNGATVITFFDNCYSGGMLDEVCQCDPTKVCALSTCTADGFGFDECTFQHGAWTYYFLIKTVCGTNPKPNNLGDAFDKAITMYPYKDGNLPQIRGNKTIMF